MTVATLQSQAWSVPQEWVGDRCLIIGGGESVLGAIPHIRAFRGRVIAIKEAVLLRPDADVMFISGEQCHPKLLQLIAHYQGPRVITRGRPDPGFPDHVLRVGRTKEHTKLAEQRNQLAGWDGGTSTINLAYHFGAREVLLIGYDMRGGRWMNEDKAYRAYAKPAPSKDQHAVHLSPLPDFAKDCQAKGLRVVNCSPISAATCFEYQSLEAFL